MSLKRYALGLAALGLGSAALAQPPIGLSVPNGPGAFPPISAPIPGPGPVGIAPRPAMPTQNTLWSFLGVSADQREYRQRARQDTPLGQLRQRILPNPRLQTPSLAELQAPGPVGAASQVKLDRANAEKRMEAVEYLGTVDCHYWPEAEEALIGALRGDRNECVRLQAATVLANGCCCTKKVIKALNEVVAGTDCDGFPAEKSPRVRAAAQTALEHCLACFCDMESKCPDKNCDKKPAPLPELAPLPKPGGEKIDPVKKPGGEKSQTETFYELAAKTPSEQIIAEARKALKIQIPYEMTGGAINQLDLIAAGEPGPNSATGRSPRPTSLMGWFAAKPSTPGVTPLAARPMGSANMVMHESPMPAPMAATTQWSPMPTPTMAPTQPKPMPAAGATAQPKPMPPAVATTQPKPMPVVAPTMTTSTSSKVPLTAPTKTMPVKHVAEDKAEKVGKMMKGLVPVSELTAAIDDLSGDDLKSHPAVASELVTYGAQSTSLPVRLASVKAIVRCHVKTPEAMTVLRNAAQTDPENAVRAAAAAGLSGK